MTIIIEECQCPQVVFIEAPSHREHKIVNGKTLCISRDMHVLKTKSTLSKLWNI